jgi:hypothetical protein
LDFVAISPKQTCHCGLRGALIRELSITLRDLVGWIALEEG